MYMIFCFLYSVLYVMSFMYMSFAPAGGQKYKSYLI